MVITSPLDTAIYLRCSEDSTHQMGYVVMMAEIWGSIPVAAIDVTPKSVFLIG